MLIECPSCARSYAIRPTALGAGGRSVVCAACQTRWFVATREADDESEQPAIAPLEETIADRRRFVPERVSDPRHLDRRMEAFQAARRRTGRTDRHPRAAIAFASIAACLIGAMGLIGERTAIVRVLPRLAGVYATIGLPVNVRGLEFKDVKTVRADESGRNTMAVSGNIRNVARTRTAVPRITFDIRNDAGLTIASWTEGAPKRMLAGDESVAFATHTPDLPVGSKDVVVRFASDSEPRDASQGPASPSAR